VIKRKERINKLRRLALKPPPQLFLFSSATGDNTPDQVFQLFLNKTFIANTFLAQQKGKSLLYVDDP